MRKRTERPEGFREGELGLDEKIKAALPAITQEMKETQITALAKDTTEETINILDNLTRGYKFSRLSSLSIDWNRDAFRALVGLGISGLKGGYTRRCLEKIKSEFCARLYLAGYEGHFKELAEYVRRNTLSGKEILFKEQDLAAVDKSWAELLRVHYKTLVPLLNNKFKINFNYASSVRRRQRAEKQVDLNIQPAKQRRPLSKYDISASQGEPFEDHQVGEIDEE